MTTALVVSESGPRSGPAVLIGRDDSDSSPRSALAWHSQTGLVLYNLPRALGLAAVAQTHEVAIITEHAHVIQSVEDEILVTLTFDTS